MKSISQPNFLFVTAEDICPNLGCYGDPNARTPNLDHFAANGVRFDHVFSIHPCCSPSRSCLATGVYPTRLGTMQHRGRVKVSPEEVRCMTSLLREDGYYCFNGMKGGHYKTDYNFTPQDQPWDKEGSIEIEWRNRLPGQPFFGQVNLVQTHQSQYGRRKPGTPLGLGAHNPAGIVLPSYHPDTPAVRTIWAEYHDRMTSMDEDFSAFLRMLDEDGLADDTIVIFLGDNGMGIPAGKVWLWDQGLHVPMIIRFPEKWKHLSPVPDGEACKRLISFVDFAPTILALAGISLPAYMQGIPFLGSPSTAEREYAYAARDYHEAADFDFSRAVRNKRFHYIRNFFPHLGWDAMPYSWDRAPYMLEEWRQRAEAGQLIVDTRLACFFMNGKPVEELYDMEHDPDQMNNLADDPDYREVLHHLRGQCGQWIVQNNDLGLLSQYEMYTRSERDTPYKMGADPKRNPIGRLLAAANVANRLEGEHLPALYRLLEEDDPALRRWGAIGMNALSRLPEEAEMKLLKLLGDDSPDIRMSAAETLCRTSHVKTAVQILIDALTHESRFVRTEALVTMCRVNEAAREALPALESALPPSGHMGLGSFDCVPGAIDMVRSCLGVRAEKIAKNHDMVDYAASRLRYYDRC